MDLLPTEIAFEVWLETDYETLKRLCAIARASSDPKLQMTKDLCDDPQSWITRAHDKLGINPSDFWARSPVEQALPLPDGTPGKRAQMRYVELVSRRGAVSDSLYFLEPWEIVRRAFLEGRATLFYQAVKHLPNGKSPNMLMHEFQSSPIIITDFGQEAYYHLFARPNARDRNVVQELFEKGLRGDISDPHGHVLRGLVVGGYEREAKELFLKHPRMTLRVMIVQAALETNNLSLLTWLVEQDPRLVKDAINFHGALEGLNGVSNPEIIRYLAQLDHDRIIGDLRYPLKYRCFGLLNKGNIAMTDELIDVFGFDIADTLPQSGTRFESTWALMLAGSYGLQVSEWLLDHGIDVKGMKEAVKDRFYEYPGARGAVASKAVREYLEL